jgi:hypothetical protein
MHFIIFTIFVTACIDSSYCAELPGERTALDIDHNAKCEDVSGDYESTGVSDWVRPRKDFKPTIIFAIKNHDFAYIDKKKYDWFNLSIRNDSLTIKLYENKVVVSEISIPAVCSSGKWQTDYRSQRYVDGATTYFSYVNMYNKDVNGRLVVISNYFGDTKELLFLSHESKGAETIKFSPRK